MMRGSRQYQVKLASCPLSGEMQPKLELLAAKHTEPKKKKRKALKALANEGAASCQYRSKRGQ